MLIAVAIGFVISFAAALLAYRYRRFERPIGFVAAAIYTVPSIALFQLLVPVTGLGVLTVEIALVGYTFLILFRNILAGLRAAPPEVLEAARGMGLTRRQTLRRIELPLALPAIVAGLRIATVSTIALATIAAFVIPEGLGRPIFIALREQRFKTELIAAGMLAILLALARRRALRARAARAHPVGSRAGDRHDCAGPLWRLRRRARVHRRRAASCCSRRPGST